MLPWNREESSRPRRRGWTDRSPSTFKIWTTPGEGGEIAITILGVIWGADEWTEIEDMARTKIGWLTSRHDWPGLRSIACVQARRTVPDGDGGERTLTERRYDIGSLEGSDGGAAVGPDPWPLGRGEGPALVSGRLLPRG